MQDDEIEVYSEYYLHDGLVYGGKFYIIVDGEKCYTKFKDISQMVNMSKHLRDGKYLKKNKVTII